MLRFSTIIAFVSAATLNLSAFASDTMWTGTLSDMTVNSNWSNSVPTSINNAVFSSTLSTLNFNPQVPGNGTLFTA